MDDQDVIDVLAREQPPVFGAVRPEEIMRSARRRRRVNRGARATTCGVVVAGLVGIALASPFRSSEPAPAVRVPPPGASVTEVADTYLQAVAAQQCETVRALTLSPDRIWCDDPVLLSHHRDGKLMTLPGGTGSPDQTCVHYTIDTTGSRDGSWTAGVTPWFLCFTPTPNGWRLSDMGPV